MKTDLKNEVLLTLSDLLQQHEQGIINCNKKDVEGCGDLDPTLLDRLKVDTIKVGSMVQSVLDVRLMEEVDCAAVYHNASSRFTDGGQFGFGVEIAISTQKLHFRGPLGATQLVSNKWFVMGYGQIRD